MFVLWRISKFIFNPDINNESKQIMLLEIRFDANAVLIRIWIKLFKYRKIFLSSGAEFWATGTQKGLSNGRKKFMICIKDIFFTF